MTSSHQISFVTLQDNEECSTISHIGGIKPDGSMWKVEIEVAINCLEIGKCKFFIWDGFEKVNLVIAICGKGHATLKSEQDESDTNILHSLPPFPEKLVAV